MIIAENLEKIYNNRKVVKGVCFEANKGEVVALLGPNGAGKTTCFYMIVGIVTPDHGKVLLNGSDITKTPMYIKSSIGIGYLPQESSIFRGLTVEENIMSVLEIKHKSKEKRAEKLEELLEEFDIKRIRNSMSILVSGGERRRLEIARLFASEPEFIFLDEPFAGIDPIVTSEIVDIIKSIAKDKNVGVVITDHNVRETAKVADRIYVIYDGCVLMQGKTKDVLNDSRVKDVYLGSNFEM